MAATTPSLDDLRRQIDEIDTQLHDLLMRRARFGRAIGAAKGKDTVFLRPAREAQVLRRLVARHAGAFPRPVLVRIWREIFSAFIAMQGPFTVAAVAPEGGPDLRELARDHFGSQNAVRSYKTNMGVLRAVTEGAATIGVLPLPRGEETDPWWRHLARGGERVPRVVARLPFAPALQAGGSQLDGLAVTPAPQDESGGDRSLLLLETVDQISRGSLIGILGKHRLQALDIQFWADGDERRLHLIEVEGYVPADDARLTALAENGEIRLANLWQAGGYAVPLTEDDLKAEAEVEA